MKDKIIQLGQSTVFDKDNNMFTIVYGLSRSGRVYHLGENHDKWIFKAESPEAPNDPS